MASTLANAFISVFKIERGHKLIHNVGSLLGFGSTAIMADVGMIYRTTDGKIILEDELLNFLLIKSRTLDQDNIIKIVKSSFSSQRIEASKAVMAELFPDNKCWSSHRGEKKDEIYVKMCLAVFKEKGELPRFVFHYIDELPPFHSNMWMFQRYSEEFSRLILTLNF